MKFRTSFVTNSSSSSFILGLKDNLTEEQKNMILEYALDTFFGHKVASTKEELDEFYKSYYDVDVSNPNWREEDDYYADDYDTALEAINAGKTIRLGRVDYEDADWQLSHMYQDLWKQMDKDAFTGIDTDLSY